MEFPWKGTVSEIRGRGFFFLKKEEKKKKKEELIVDIKQ